MKTRSITSAVSIAAITLVLTVAASAQSQVSLAKAVVSNLYKAQTSPFSQTTDRGLVDKYFTKDLADMIRKDATTANGEVGVIDGDPLYNAQDADIKALVIGGAAIETQRTDRSRYIHQLRQKTGDHLQLKKNDQMLAHRQHRLRQGQ